MKLKKYATCAMCGQSQTAESELLELRKLHPIGGGADDAPQITLAAQLNALQTKLAKAEEAGRVAGAAVKRLRTALGELLSYIAVGDVQSDHCGEYVRVYLHVQALTDALREVKL